LYETRSYDRNLDEIHHWIYYKHGLPVPTRTNALPFVERGECGEFREWTFEDHSELLGRYPRFRLHSEVGSYHIGKAEPRENRVDEGGREESTRKEADDSRGGRV